MKLSSISLPSLLKVTFVFFLYLLTALEGKSQGVGCKSPEPTSKEIAEREAHILALKKKMGGARVKADNYTFVPVLFHVVRYSNGTGGVSTAQINEVLKTINADFQSSTIQFYLAGAIPHFIDSDTFYDFEFGEESDLTQGNDVTNAINIYVVGSLSFQASLVTGYAYYPSVLAISNRLFVRADRINDDRTLSHELGHYFNVLHTFQDNTNSDITKRELVTRGTGANCSTVGDLLCDTPADPQNLSGSTTSGCSYTGTTTDANGDPFTPSLVNMMGYYYSCGNEFTAGQHQRMSDGLLLRMDEANQYTLNFPVLAAVPTQLVASQNANGVLVTFQDIGTQEGGYIVERATHQAGPYTPIKGLDVNVTSWLDATVTTNTLYYYRVRASNSNEYSAPDTSQVKLFYCRPTYNTANSPIFIADFILSKNGTNLISKINTGTSATSFSDFTSSVGQVTAGQSYNFLARAVTGGSGSYFPQHLSVWIDLNHNGVFETSEIRFQTSESNLMSPTVVGVIMIPAQTPPGLTRMRVRSQYNTNGLVQEPCAQLQYGEAEDYTLNINSNTPATVQVSSLSRTSACPGDIVEVSYLTTGFFEPDNVFTVQMAKAPDYTFVSIPTTSSASPLVATIPNTLASEPGYKLRVVASQSGVSSVEGTQLFEIRPRIEVILSGGGTITEGDSATLTITKTVGSAPWEFSLSNGQGSMVSTAASVFVKVAPTVTTTYTLATVQNEACGTGTGSGSATVSVTPKPVLTVQIRVFLEGPYRTNNGLMITTLNQRGLLPGQVPVGATGVPTPAGQPYSGSPWNYAGTESVGSYQPTTVDWILVSFRAGSPSVQNTVYKTAALLANDGLVTFINPPNLVENTAYYIVIEHRNHLGVMSHTPVSIQNEMLQYDFTTQDSYTATNPVSIGQKKIGIIFAALSSEGNKNPANQYFVINVNDYSLWKGENGKFDIYSTADFNMDAQISATDKAQWNSNNSKFSFIGRQ